MTLKTNNIPDWTQADMDLANARYKAAYGEDLFPVGSTIADLPLSSDWNQIQTELDLKLGYTGATADLNMGSRDIYTNNLYVDGELNSYSVLSNTYYSIYDNSVGEYGYLYYDNGTYQFKDYAGSYTYIATNGLRLYDSGLDGLGIITMFNDDYHFYGLASDYGNIIAKTHFFYDEDYGESGYLSLFSGMYSFVESSGAPAAVAVGNLFMFDSGSLANGWIQLNSDTYTFYQSDYNYASIQVSNVYSNYVTTTYGIFTGVGSLGNPAYACASDSNTGMYFPAADTIGFVTGAAERARIVASTGNVLIGTTTDVTAFGGAKLQVRSTGSSTATWRGRIVAGGSNATFLMGEYNSNAWLGAHNGALSAWQNLYIQPQGGADCGIGYDGTTFATGTDLFLGGNFGMGTATFTGGNLPTGGTNRMIVNGTGGSTMVIQDTTGYANFAAIGATEGNFSITDTGATSGSRVWNFNSDGGVLKIRRLSDNYGSVSSTPLTILASGAATFAASLEAASFITAGDIEITDSAKGVILESPDATRWRITIDNSGTLTATSL